MPSLADACPQPITRAVNGSPMWRQVRLDRPPYCGQLCLIVSPPIAASSRVVARLEVTRQRRLARVDKITFDDKSPIRATA